MTGESGFRVFLQTTSAATCNLSGFPWVTLESGGRRVPFTLRYGGGPYLDPHPPQYVTLRPGRYPSAFFEVAKYRCDLGTIGRVTTAMVTLPGDTSTWTLNLAHVGPTLYWCKPVPSGPDTPTYRDGMTTYVGSFEYNRYDTGPFSTTFSSRSGTSAPARTLLALVIRATRTTDGYRLVLAPASYANAQYLRLPGKAAVTYEVPASLVTDPSGLVGPVEITARGSTVTNLAIMGG